MGALYSLINDGLSKIMKAKVRGKQGFNKAQEEKDALWMLKTIENITLNFEETKPKFFAIDDQMERIMKLKQGDATNEDYIKMVSKELKVYENHGGDFLWGKTQVRASAVRSKLALDEFRRNNNVMATAEETEEIYDFIKKALKEEILAMAFLKWADKKRNGNLQIGLKIRIY
jgi:hypothetical protein